MLTNAQLDNDKQKLQYEVDLLKDQLSDSQEQKIQLELHLFQTTRVCHCTASCSCISSTH